MLLNRINLKRVILISLFLINIVFIVISNSLKSLTNITLFSFIIIFCIIFNCLYIFLFLRTFKKYNKEHQKILKSLEKNLYLIKAFDNFYRDIDLLPDITIDDTLIKIDISNAVIRKAIDNNIKYLSSFLPSGYLVNEVNYTEDENYILITYENLNKDERVYFNSVEDFNNFCNNSNQFDFYLSKNNKVSLNDYPHWLITGATGSGKTFFSSGFLVNYFLKKGYEVSIADYKKSLIAYEDCCKCSFDSLESIYNNFFLSLQNDLHTRQEQMRGHLKNNPNVLACEIGFKPKIYLIEEAVALLGSAITKEDKAIVNNMLAILTECVVLARQLNIHIIIVSQMASVDILDSKIRSNLTPIVFGSASESLLITAFNTKSVNEIPLIHSSKKGIGLIKLDNKYCKVVAPTFNVSLISIINSQEKLPKANATDINLID